MTDRDPARGAQFAMDLIEEEEEARWREEVARIEAMSTEELDRELLAEGIRPEDIPSLDEFLKKLDVAPDHPQGVKMFGRKRSRVTWVVSLIAAAIGCILLFIGVYEAPQIEAWWHPAPEITPDRAPLRSPPPSPLAKAAALRDEARREWTQGNKDTAKQRLDEARDLDPAGEKTHEVEELRTLVDGPPHVITGDKPHLNGGP